MPLKGCLWKSFGITCFSGKYLPYSIVIQGSTFEEAEVFSEENEKKTVNFAMHNNNGCNVRSGGMAGNDAANL